MKTYKIDDELSAKYHGCGWALAAIKDGKPTGLVYFNDIFPELHLPSAPHYNVFLKTRLEKLYKKAATTVPSVVELATLGTVTIGMLSGWEFVVL